MPPFIKNLLIWIGIFVVALLLFNYFQGESQDTTLATKPYSSFLLELNNQNVSSVTIKDQQLVGTLHNGTRFRTYIPNDPSLINKLVENKVAIDVAPQVENSSPFISLLINWLPMIFIIAVWIFLMRQMQGGGGRAMGFGKSRARLLTEHTAKVTFNDVAGIEEAKQELEEVVEFLRQPKKFQRLGGKIPKGVLLVGPPGTGKTLTARAVAGEANVPFFTISGSDFVEMFVGVGASRVRDMFEQGKKNAPCIIFIDELDAVGRHRGAGLGGGNDEREQTLNQLLVEMDGFESNEGVILIAATNRPDVLDPALLRPGRFDRQVVVPNPDVKGREKILKVHAKKVPLSADVSLKTIARGTPGFSGASLANLINEAALLSARRNKRSVSMQEMEDAKDKVLMGSERRSLVMSEEERRLTAYHEAGHALATVYSPASDPIHKATIVPRGRALGMVMRLPERDDLSLTLEKIKANLVVGMGGRIAEEIIFGKDKITTGASSDIKMITELARRMITEWGFSEKLGTVRYNENQDEVFLGHSVARSQNISEETATIIDTEIRRVVDDATLTCRNILKKHLDQLEIIAQALLEYETLNKPDIDALLRGETLNRDDDDSPEGDEPTNSVPSSRGEWKPSSGNNNPSPQGA